MGSSGMCPPNISAMVSPMLAGGGGGTGLESKKEGMVKTAPGVGSPGISMSSPALMKLTACTAPQSEVTNPLKPSLIAQNLRQRGLVAAGVGAIDAVVGAHDRRNVGFDRGIERRDVDLVQRLIVDEDVAGCRSHTRRSA